MKHVVLAGIIFGNCIVSPAKAGSVVPLADSPEMTGKVTLTSNSIHVEGAGGSDINLPDVLEADFSETPFKLNYYFDTGDKNNSLPPGWASGNIGALSASGSAENSGGVITIKSPPLAAKPEGPRLADNIFFAGCPWTGDFQWTARLTKMDADSQNAFAGLMLRDTLAPGSIKFILGTSFLGNGVCGFRPETDKQEQLAQVSIDVPSWLRLTRYGPIIFASLSADGKQWDLVGQNHFKSLDNPLIGLFVGARREKESGEASFDQLSITPVTSSAQVLPPGVILQSGSFLAGAFDRLVNDPSVADPAGTFRSGNNIETIARSKIAAVLMLPSTRDQIASMASHVGLLMKNGDVQDGDFDSISGVSVEVNSVLLGITVYNRSEVRGCFLKPALVQPAPYQFRLRDGSIVNASGFTINNNDLVIQEISGLGVNASIADVAQFRAGPAVAQPMAELAWKATPPAASTPAPAPASNPAPAPNAPAAANANAAPLAETPPLVQSWAGPDQEQILATAVGTAISFPLPGKFRAMGVKIALSPDSPPNSQITIRVLADGREIGHSPPFKAGDQPRFMELTLQDPRSVTLVADSIFAGTKVLFIDPVAIKDN